MINKVKQIEIKEYISIPNIVFLAACLFLAFYGLYYNSLSNIWAMVVMVPFILFQAFWVKRIRFDINLLFLAEAFFIKAMIEQHTGRSWDVPSTIAMPMLMYMFGKLLVAVKKDEAPVDRAIGRIASECRTVFALASLTFGTTILGLLNYRLTRRSPIASMGYYSIAFTGDTVYSNKWMFMFNFFFAGCFVGAIILYLIWTKMGQSEKIAKFRMPIFMAIACGIELVVLVWYFNNIRWEAFKEIFNALLVRHWGNNYPTVMYNYSSSNMWLDYCNNYGIMVGVPLIIFAGLTVKDAVKLYLNEQVSFFVKSLLLLLFIILSFYYFIEPSATPYPYLWYIGLIVNGMISHMAESEG